MQGKDKLPNLGNVSQFLLQLHLHRKEYDMLLNGFG
jgi:hypothetical protein